MDFEVINNQRLTFHSNETSITFPIKIIDDGLFEADEEFSVILSTRVLPLQLNTNSTLNLRDTVCRNVKSLSQFSLTNGTFGDGEEILIDSGQVFISHEDGEIVLTLTNNETDRVSLSPPATRVTIMDDDGE